MLDNMFNHMSTICPRFFFTAGLTAPMGSFKVPYKEIPYGDFLTAGLTAEGSIV